MLFWYIKIYQPVSVICTFILSIAILLCTSLSSIFITGLLPINPYRPSFILCNTIDILKQILKNILHHLPANMLKFQKQLGKNERLK